MYRVGNTSDYESQANPTAVPPESQNRSPYRLRVAGIVLASAALLAACSENEPAHTLPVGPVAPTIHTVTPTSEIGPSASATPEKPQVTTPELPDPLAFKNGAFLGAVEINYQDDAKRPWGAINRYYKNRDLTKPAHFNDPFVHRIIAGAIDKNGVDIVADEALAQGVVLDKTSTRAMLVMAMHDVAPVHAKVRVNDETYDQQRMGINAVVVPGDTLTWLLPADIKGYVNKYVFEAIGSYVISASNQKQIDELFQVSTSEDGPVLRTYQYWEPGNVTKRLVDEWKLVSARVVKGSVQPVGGIGPIGPNR